MHEREAGRAGPRVLAGVLLVAVAGAMAWWHGRAQSAEDALFPQGTYAYLDDEPDQLFAASAAPTLVGANARSTATSARHPIRISLDAARNAVERGAVAVVLPDNTRYDVRYERQEEASTGDWTFIGRVATPLGDLASVLTFGPDGVFGTLPAPDGRMFHVTTSHGASVITLAGGMIPPGATPDVASGGDVMVPPSQAMKAPPGRKVTAPRAVPSRQPAMASAPPPRATATPAPGEVHFVDLLGIYAENLADLRGSAVAAETEYANLVAVSNQAHIDSGTGLRLRLAALVSSDIPADLSNRSVLYMVSAGPLPDGQDVTALRQDALADMVAVLRPHVPNDGTCGIAWLNGADLAPQEANAAYAVSISNVAPCGPYVMAHEIGHGLGSMHDAPNAPFLGAYAFSMGYRQEGPPSFTTIMGYEAGIPSVGRFSDPGSTACESACGTHDADNVRSIRLMAGRAARFTNPPGTLVVDDVVVEEGNGAVTASVSVRLGAPAGAGGTSFDLSLVDGSARAGLDYAAKSGRFYIPEGETQKLIDISILGDRTIEPEETFEVRIRNLEGAEPLRAEATVVVVNDDPRLQISGRLIFPPGTPEPAGRSIHMYAYDRDRHVASATISPPEWRYAIGVMPATDLVMDFQETSGIARHIVTLGAVDSDIERDVTMSRELEVSGRLRFPDGVAAPGSAVELVLWQRGAGGDLGYLLEAAPPDFEFSHRAFNAGSDVQIEVRPPAPFHPVTATVHGISADVRRDVEVPNTPEVAGIEAGPVEEGMAAVPNDIPVTVSLSGVAGPGGATVEFTTISRTARKDEDFEVRGGTLQVPAGERSATSWTVLRAIGDFDPEGDETFDLVVTGADGARVRDGLRSEVVILDDDAPPAFADMDGDGASDLLWHSSAAERVRWQFVRDGRILGEGERYVGGMYRVLAMEDFTGDGGTDFLFGNDAGNKLVFWDRVLGSIRIHIDDVHAAGNWEVIGTADIYANDGSFVVSRNAAGDAVRLTWLNSDLEFGASVANDARLVATGDFDGDGRDELLWRDGNTDRFWLWSSDNGIFHAPVRIDLDVEAGVVFGAADLDGDGREEVLSHSSRDRVLRAWSLDGSIVTVEIDHPLPEHYRLAGMGDYDADGRADFVWRDARRTGLWMWLARNGTYHENWMGAHPDGDWSPILPSVPDAVSGAGGNGGALQVGDVDGDGSADLVWWNPSMRQLDWWRMRSGSRTGLMGRSIGEHLATVAQGDFDGDGGADLLLRDAEGRLWLEPVLQEKDATRARIPADAGQGWEVVGVGDFDGDGRDDLLWQKASVNRWRTWRMDGTAVPREVEIEVPGSPTLEGLGDVDGDGHADAIWHDAMAGSLVLAPGGEAPLATVPGGRPAGRQALAAVGDVDGDGDTELLWHALDAGTLQLWNPGEAPGTWAFTQAVPATYRVAGSGDIDGDGQVDILWRDHRRGELRAWRWRSGEFEDGKVADYPGPHLVVPRMVQDQGSSRRAQCDGPLC